MCKTRFIIAFAALLGMMAACVPASAQIIFQDDFESGMGSWTTATGKTPMDLSSAQNIVPASGMYSALANHSNDYIYHNLPYKTKTAFRASWWVYDDGLTRAYGEARSFPGSGYPGTATQVYAAGKYNSVTSGSPYNPLKYQGRIAYPSTIGWFNLDGPGSPNRLTGWHKFTIETGGTGSVKFYVDGILSKTVSGANPAGVNCIMLGLGAGTETANAWYDGVVAEDGNNLLKLNVTEDSLYVKCGEPVQVYMDVSELTQKVNGCQAMLGYNSVYLYAASSCVAPGGLVWDQLIYNSWDVSAGVPGEIDTAIGVYAQGSVGTQDPGTVAIITLTPTGYEGTTTLVFRPDDFPDPFLVGSTYLSDMSNNPVWPFTSDSQQIVIDCTPALLNIASAKQGGTELLTSLGSTTPAVQGTVSVQVTASDLNGLPAAPALNAYDAALAPLPAVFNNQSPAGTFNYTITIPSTAANGLAQIRVAVFDKAGNRTDDLDHFLIDKNQVTGQIELEGFVGASRTVTFVATNGSTVLKTWNLTLTGWASSIASYTLTNVPDGTTGLSAKTAWNLRSKVTVTLIDGQATADFIGIDKLLGGDLNGTNTINILDYSILKSSWGAGAAGDIDGNGSTGMLDYTTMKTNWFTSGDVQ